MYALRFDLERDEWPFSGVFRLRFTLQGCRLVSEVIAFIRPRLSTMGRGEYWERHHWLWGNSWLAVVQCGGKVVHYRLECNDGQMRIIIISVSKRVLIRMSESFKVGWIPFYSKVFNWSVLELLVVLSQYNNLCVVVWYMVGAISLFTGIVTLPQYRSIRFKMCIIRVRRGVVSHFHSNYPVSSWITQSHDSLWNDASTLQQSIHQTQSFPL